MGNKPGSKKRNPTELTEVRQTWAFYYFFLRFKKKANFLNKDEIVILLANTSFTREEIKKWHEGFIVNKKLLKI
jgi:hypothetical protein